MLYLTSSLDIFPLSLPEYYPIFSPLWLAKNHRTSFYFLPSNILTLCVAPLLRKSGPRTAQGTGKADWQEVFSDGTDHPSPSVYQGRGWGKKIHPYPCAACWDSSPEPLVVQSWRIHCATHHLLARFKGVVRAKVWRHDCDKPKFQEFFHFCFVSSRSV